MISSFLPRGADAGLRRALLRPQQARGEGRGLRECCGWVHGLNSGRAWRDIVVVEAARWRGKERKGDKGAKDGQTEERKSL